MTVTVENKRVICPSTGLGQSGTTMRNTLKAPYLLHRLSQALVGQRGTAGSGGRFSVLGLRRLSRRGRPRSILGGGTTVFDIPYLNQSRFGRFRLIMFSILVLNLGLNPNNQKEKYDENLPALPKDLRRR